MKKNLLCLLLLLSGILHAQIIDNPSFKARSGSRSNITRIERTSESTRLYIHAIFRPHWWIREDGDNYLEDAATGKKFFFKGAEGIELKKEVYMPASGEMDYVLIFDPLPKETQIIHYLDPSSSEGNTYDINLVPPKKKKPSPLESIKGNWYKTDFSNSWEYGIYDSLTIMNNRIYVNQSIRKKGKRIEMVVKDKKDGNTSTLLISPKKDGNCQIQVNGSNEDMFTRQLRPIRTIASDTGYSDFFHTDTTCLQGYINGYDSRLGFETGLIYFSNEINREDYPTVVQIHPDGSFECKFVIHHPISQSITIGNNWLPFYIEPGQTLTMYIDWEDILARSRARDRNFPIKNTAYMGPSASLSYLAKDCNSLISYNYEDMYKSQKELTPNQYKEHIQPFISQWEHIADSLIQIYQPSKKAIRQIKNKVKLTTGIALYEFLLSRNYYAKEDTTNEALKVQADNTYFSFLNDMPLNDITTLIESSDCSIFINRFEYMDPFRETYGSTAPQENYITSIYPKKPILSFLKEKGVKLNADQETIRKRHESLAGKKVTVSFKEIEEENKKLGKLYEDERELIDEYLTLQEQMEESQEDRDKSIVKEQLDEIHRKDSILASLYKEPNPLLWQVAKVRALRYSLQSISTKQIASQYIDEFKKQLTLPFLAMEAERILESTHPEKEEKSYQLPEGKATDIFRNIIKNHPNKVLFVDFWATSCGPCRGGIEATANLRKIYKNHPEFQFIYITGEKESPRKAYEEYVEKNLKGEASYYVTETEYNYLRELFHFNGIPHYELVEKDGSISRDNQHSYTIQNYLENRFGIPKKE